MPRKKKSQSLEDDILSRPRVKGKPWRMRKDGALDVNVPKTKERGNTKGDAAWLEMMTDAGLIEPIDEEDGEVPFGALKKYTGLPIDDGSFWQLPPEGRRCAGRAYIRDEEGRYIIGENKKPLMRPCANWAIKGGTVCVSHGGGTGVIRRKAELRLLSAADSVIGALIQIALDQSNDAASRVKAINSVLDRAGVKAGQEITVTVPEWQRLLRDMWPTGGDGGGEASDEDRK